MAMLSAWQQPTSEAINNLVLIAGYKVWGSVDYIWIALLSYFQLPRLHEHAKALRMNFIVWA